MNIRARTTIMLAIAAISLPGLSQDWDALIQDNDVHAFKAALKKQDSRFKIDASFMARICDRPEMVQAVLDHLYGQSDHQTAASVAPSPNAPGKPAPPPAHAGNDGNRSHVPFSGGNDNNAVQRLYKKLADLEGQNDPAGVKKRLEARSILTGFIMDKASQFTAQVPGLPEWVSEMIQSADKARRKGYPQITLTADKRVSFTASDQEKGVKAYMSLYMVKQSPDGETPFELRDELLTSLDSWPLAYDQETDDFELAVLGKHYSTIVNFRKIFNDVEPITLYPGQWALRIKHTNGYNQLRSDQTAYFTVEPGKNYELELSWEKKKGSRMLQIEPREID